MAQKTIPQLNEISTVDENAVLPVDTGSQTYKITSVNLAANLKRLGATTVELIGDDTFTVPAGVHQLFVSVKAVNPNKKISGGNPKAFLDIRGQAWTWGANFDGRLGDGTTVSKSSPVQVIGGHDFVDLQAGDACMAALKIDGSVWTWGANDFGFLGDGTTLGKSSPVQVIGGHVFTKLASGLGYNPAALKADGSAWTWGYNSDGQLGDGTSVNKSSPVQVIGGHVFTDIVTVDTASAALKADGSVWTWGSNGFGQLGDGTTVGKSSPVQVIGGHVFTALTRGQACFFALKADGSIWAWGYNNNGQLGDGTETNRSSPVQVIGGHVFTKLGQGSRALKADGSAWAWGYNEYYDLGDGTTVNKSSPVQVIGSDFRELASTVAIDQENKLQAWGKNDAGQVGNGNTTDQSTPVFVAGNLIAKDFLQGKSVSVYETTPGEVISYTTLTSLTFGDLTFTKTQQENSFLVSW